MNAGRKQLEGSSSMGGKVRNTPGNVMLHASKTAVTYYKHTFIICYTYNLYTLRHNHIITKLPNN